MPKITALPIANAAATGDLLVLDQNNITKRIDFNVLQSSIANAGTVQSLINSSIPFPLYLKPGAGTADFKTAANAVAAAAAANGGAVFVIPPGNYTLSEANLGNYTAAIGSSIDFNGVSNVTIWGYGATITLPSSTPYNGGKVWFRFRNCSNIRIKGLSFVGYQTADGSAANGGVPLYFDTAASNILIEDVSLNSGGVGIEFQTDDLVNMGGVKYKNVTLRNISTTNYHHAMELLHIDGLFTYGIRMSAIGTGNNINFRGMYVLGVTNWNGDGIYSDNCGFPGTGGVAIFVREYAPTTGTLPNFNCDGINLTNVKLDQCLQGGLEFNIQLGSMSNVNVSNLEIAANNTYSYGGGLLEFASDGATPTGFSNFQFSNLSIVGSTKAGLDGAANVLFRDSSNVARAATIYTDFKFVNTEITANNSAPWSQGFSGGWTNRITLTNTKISHAILGGLAVVVGKTRDWLADSFRLEGKIDFGLNTMVRAEFRSTYLGWTALLNSTDMAPIIVNGLPLTAAVISVSGGGNDDNVGSVASPLLTNAEAAARLLKITQHDISPVTETNASRTVLLTDEEIIANRAGTVTLTLISAALLPGRRLKVRTIQNQTVVSANSDVVPLAGGAAGTAILAGTAGKWAELQSDGTNWQIMAGN